MKSGQVDHHTQRALQLFGGRTHRADHTGADSNRSGRPTSPTKRKSPPATPIGMSAPLPRSVTTKTMCRACAGCVPNFDIDGSRCRNGRRRRPMCRLRFRPRPTRTANRAFPPSKGRLRTSARSAYSRTPDRIVGVDVGLGDHRDREAFLGSDAVVAVDVAFGIDQAAPHRCARSRRDTCTATVPDR